ncbi:DUF1206 domain-containing protein [Salinisphaera sp. Q1T1-3]|nr:DUF1206 domain-containing protein [Salinisphaera sp. Q1T1-3]
MRWVARIGYGARGVVYLMFGALAMRTAVTLSDVHDVRGTLGVMHQMTGGGVLLLGAAAGLAAYALWRLVQGGFDTDGHGWGLRALIVRGALLASAAVYGSLAWASLKLVAATAHRTSQPVQHAVAATLDWPAGREMVVLGGLIGLIAGIAHIHKAWCAGFRRWFSASPAAMRWIDPVSRIGLCARGLLFLGVGGFIVYSGITLQPQDALGVAELLDWVRGASYGRWLLAAWAVGVMLFGVYSLIEAFVRRVDPTPYRAPR